VLTARRAGAGSRCTSAGHPGPRDRNGALLAPTESGGEGGPGGRTPVTSPDARLCSLPAEPKRSRGPRRRSSSLPRDAFATVSAGRRSSVRENGRGALDQAPLALPHRLDETEAILDAGGTKSGDRFGVSRVGFRYAVQPFRPSGRSPPGSRKNCQTRLGPPPFSGLLRVADTEDAGGAGRRIARTSGRPGVRSRPRARGDRSTPPGVRCGAAPGSMEAGCAQGRTSVGPGANFGGSPAPLGNFLPKFAQHAPTTHLRRTYDAPLRRPGASPDRAYSATSAPVSSPFSTTSATALTTSSSRMFITRTPCEARP
jgi:hypothetical protein